MNLKQLRKAIRWQSGSTTLIIEKDGKKYEIKNITFSINNDDSVFVILHTKDDDLSKEPC